MSDGWAHFPDDPKAIKRHNELVLSSIPTADLVAELEKRDEVKTNDADAGKIIISFIHCGVYTALSEREGPAKILVVRE